MVDADMADDVFDLCSRRYIHQVLKVLQHSKVYFPFPLLLFHHLSFTLAHRWERQHFYLLVEMFLSDFDISKLVKPTNQNLCKHQSECSCLLYEGVGAVLTMSLHTIFILFLFLSLVIPAANI